MVDIVKRYVCDACHKEQCVDKDYVLKDWEKTCDWDLCPSCARAWDNYKKSFIEQMRKVNGEAVVWNE